MISRIAAIISCLLWCCTPGSFQTEKELIDFVHDIDHNLKKTTKVGDIDFTVVYKPTDLIVAQELGKKPATANYVSELRQKYNLYYYFLISLSDGGKEVLSTNNGMETYSDLVQTMSFHMNEYVTLTTNVSDTIPVADFILNRTFNMSKTTDLLFVFSKEKLMESEWVQINLNEFGLRTGDQRFRFLKKDLDNIPNINFKITPNS